MNKNLKYLNSKKFKEKFKNSSQEQKDNLKLYINELKEKYLLKN